MEASSSPTLLRVPTRTAERANGGRCTGSAPTRSPVNSPATVLSDFGDGTDTGRNPRAVAVEADGQILVTTGLPGTVDNRPLLVRVDPVTGARAVVSDFEGSSARREEPRGVAVEAGGAILVLDAQGGLNALGQLFRVDPQTGDRALLSDFGQGANPGISPTSVAVEASGQILVTDEGHPITSPLGLLFRIDPQTGARTILSDFNTGANTGREPQGVAIEANGQILVVDKHAGTPGRGMVFRVDPQSGAREIVSDFNVGANQGGDPLALAVVPPTHGTIVVANEVVNDNGGTAVVSDWTMTVTGGNPMPASFPGAGLPGMTVTLEPGFYSVVPARGLTGYANTFSAGCGGAIAAGETRTCTITHDDQPATLRVVNEVVNDNGGTAVASDWTTTVTGANPVPASFPGAGTPGMTVTLDAGAYSVSANGPAGYGSTHSADCAGTISTGESKTCTITSDDQPGTVMVVTEVVNDDGGNAVPGDFFITVEGGNPSPASFPGEGPPGTTVTLDAGSHGARISVRPGYVLKSASPGCVGTIATGEIKTCTITTDDLPAILFAVSEVINDNGGSAVPGDFTVSVTGGDPSPASFAGQGVPGTTVLLDAGSYSFSVTGPAGYTSTLSPDCAGTIGNDERRTCKITHDDRPPTVPTCDGKVATIVGTPGLAELLGTSGDDVIVDLDGDNVVRGRGGNDTVCTGPGNDRIFLGGGADTVLDTGGRNTIEGGAGSDSITTGAGDDHIDGGGGNDTVVAGDGANVVNGQAGNDTIRTGAGDDRIDGGLGFDTCRPSTGANIVRRCEVII